LVLPVLATLAFICRTDIINLISPLDTLGCADLPWFQESSMVLIIITVPQDPDCRIFQRDILGSIRIRKLLNRNSIKNCLLDFSRPEVKRFLENSGWPGRYNYFPAVYYKAGREIHPVENVLEKDRFMAEITQYGKSSTVATPPQTPH
jgi:hypothetical protein